MTLEEYYEHSERMRELRRQFMEFWVDYCKLWFTYDTDPKQIAREMHEQWQLFRKAL